MLPENQLILQNSVKIKPKGYHFHIFIFWGGGEISAWKDPTVQRKSLLVKKIAALYFWLKFLVSAFIDVINML